MTDMFNPIQFSPQNQQMPDAQSLFGSIWRRWRIPIGILLLLLLGLGGFSMYRHFSNTSPITTAQESIFFNDCSAQDSVQADGMGTVSATTEQQNTFAFWDLQEYGDESSTMGYQEALQIFGEHKNGPRSVIYTNASQISITIPFTVLNPTKPTEAYVENLTLDATQGTLTSKEVTKSQGLIVSDSCNPYYFSIPLTFALPTPSTNAPIALQVRYSINGDAYVRKYIVQPSIWTSTVLPKTAKLGEEYTFLVGTDIPYQVTLKKADGSPFSGQNLSLANADTLLQSTGVKQFALSQQFKEVQPGVYQGTIRANDVGKFAVAPSIEGFVPNPQYSVLRATVTDSKPVSVLRVPFGMNYSTMSYYQDTAGGFMYFLYKKDTSEAEYGGFVLKKVYLKDLSPTTLDGITPLKTLGFGSFLVTPDGKSVVWGDNNDIRVFAVNANGTLADYPSFHDSGADVGGSGGVTPDSQRVLYKSYKKLVVFDLLAKKVTSLEEPGNVNKFLGGFGDAFYYISGRGDNSVGTEVVHFNGSTSAVAKRVNLLQQGMHYIDAALFTGDSPQVVIAYQNANVQAMHSGTCTYQKQLKPQEVSLGFLSVGEMDTIRTKNIQLDIGSFDNMRIVGLIPTDKGMYLEVELSMQNTNCDFSSNEIYLYPLTKDGTPDGPRIALPTATQNGLYANGRVLVFQNNFTDKEIRFYPAK